MLKQIVFILLGLAVSMHAAPTDDTSYILGPEDQVTIQVVDGDDLFGHPYRIDLDGTLTLPLVGTIKAAGTTVRQFASTLKEALKPYFVPPQVVVTLSEGKSQPVTVVGAVSTGGIHQIHGETRLFDV